MKRALTLFEMGVFLGVQVTWEWILHSQHEIVFRLGQLFVMPLSLKRRTLKWIQLVVGNLVGVAAFHHGIGLASTEETFFRDMLV